MIDFSHILMFVCGVVLAYYIRKRTPGFDLRLEKILDRTFIWVHNQTRNCVNGCHKGYNKIRDNKQSKLTREI